MALLGSDFDANDPTDSSNVSQGAAFIRDIKQRLKDFVAVSFDPDTGELLAEAIPNRVTTPYGSAGTVYTSTGTSTAPVWAAGSGVLTGSGFLWFSSVIPTGYLVATGGTKLIADYPALASVFGVTYGGDGVNTFGIPDLRGRVPAGAGTGDASDATLWTLAQKKGEEGHTLTMAETPDHQHAFPEAVTNVAGSGGTQVASAGGTAAAYQNSGIKTQMAGGGGLPHNNLQPSLAINFIIKT